MLRIFPFGRSTLWILTDRALQYKTFHKDPPTQSANKIRCYLKSGASWLYLILPSKVMKNVFSSSNLCSVLQQAFYLNLNLTTTRSFWADTPHRCSFITKFSQGFLNTNTTSPEIRVIISTELTWLKTAPSAVLFLLTSNKDPGNLSEAFKTVKLYKGWRKVWS